MDATASFLLESLESPTLSRDLCIQFYNYLKPLASIKQKHPPANHNSIKPLTLSFILEVTDRLPTLLCKNPNGDANQERDEVLLKIYELTINCLIALSPCLEPYIMHLRRVNYAYCLERCEKYEQAEKEADLLLEDLISFLVKAKPVSRSKENNKGSCTYLDAECKLPKPETVITKEYSKITELFTKIIICLANCAYKTKSKDSHGYTRILNLVEQLQPWIELLDNKGSENNRANLLKPLGGCTSVLTRGCKSFELDLVRKFCFVFLRECSKISIDKLAINARIIYNLENCDPLFVCVLEAAIELFLCECKVGTVEGIDEFLKFVAYSSGMLCDSDMEKCKEASWIINKHIYEFDKVSRPLGRILSLYSDALDFKSTTPLGQFDEAAKILKNKQVLEKLENSARVISSYPYTCGKKGSSDDSISFISYLEALQCLCEVLMPCIGAIWTQFCSDPKLLLFDTNNLTYVLQVLKRFTTYTLHSLSFRDLSETEKNGLSKSEMHCCVLNAVCYQLRICFLSNTPFQVSSVTNLLSSDWLTSQEIQIFASELSTIGCQMYEMVGHAEKAKLALELWYEVKLANIKRCRLEENITKDMVSNHYRAVASIIGSLGTCGASKSVISNITLQTLGELIPVEDSHGFRSTSFVLIKAWVKELCRGYDDGDDAPVLYQLLSKYIPSWPKKTFGRILEQELEAFAYYVSEFPKFSMRMQEKVLAILLKDVYSCENDHPVERSRVVVKKARCLRSGGTERLKDCLDCLSHAISYLLEHVSSNCSKVIDASIYHELAITYFLHAQCAQEANLDLEEVILRDVQSALHWWSVKDIEQCSGEYIGTLLCSLIDILSIKGCFRLESDICQLVTDIFQRGNLPLEKLFALLRTSRRLDHTICGSAIDLKHDYLSSCSLNWLKTDNNRILLHSLFSNHLVYPEMETRFEKMFVHKAGIEYFKNIASSLAAKTDLVSLFFAGHAYYDLCERHLLEGQFIEALYCAEKSRELRKRVLRRMFIYSEYNKPEEVHLEAKGNDMTKTWTGFKKSGDEIDSFISPWIILRCFMESNFQLGSIYESTGNVVEAEFLFKRGKAISKQNGFHVFEIIFASSLGQLYRKRKILDLAEAELKTAKTLLERIEKIISCNRCKLFIETSIDILAGDISRSLPLSSNLKEALNTYQSAVQKLEDHFEPCKFGASSDSSSLKDKKASRQVLKDVNLEVKPMRMTRSRAAAAAASRKCKDENIEMTNRQHIIAESSSGPKRVRKKSGGTTKDDKAVCCCLSCLMRKTVDSKSIQCLLDFGFEVRRRRFLLLLRLKIVRLAKGEKHDDVFSKCISLLSCKPLEIQLNEPILSDKEFGKAFSVERSLILYTMGFMFLKKSRRSRCCWNVDISMAMTWLLRAFILSREFPLLLTKVSRLLACSLQVSRLDASISMPPPLLNDNSPSLNHWVSFFHQASIGASLDIQHLYALKETCKGEEDGETNTTKTAKTTSKFQKYSFESIEQLKVHVACFFENLPSVPIICMSMLGSDYSDYLGEILTLPPSPPAWIMLSRIDSNKAQPITMLLPVNLIAGVVSEEGSSKGLRWKCPWDHSILDEVAPSFKRLMEDNYSSIHEKDGNWKNRREKIDDRFKELLRVVEESWFGPWAWLLKGDPVDKASSPFIKHGLAKAVLRGATSLDEGRACHSQISLYGGYLGHGNACRKNRLKTFSSSYDAAFESLPRLLDGAFCEPHKEEEEKEISRDPVIFVLDNGIQMLPVESLPSLGKQEIYRMPSVGSIFLTLYRNFDKKRDGYFPKINPLDAYYLVNPAGDLKHTQEVFEKFCRDHSLDLEGKAGDAPTSQELSTALKKHDMFLYFGHGSASQYISERRIEELNDCAASFLMGCSSGSLTCRGDYAPKGTSLSYLFAGSPAVIANLWDVTDKDIDKFSKAVLDSWIDSSQPTKRKRWVASYMGQARKKCSFKTLIGAAPVCYGVPTILSRGEGGGASH